MSNNVNEQPEKPPIREDDVERAMLELESKAINPSVEKIRDWLKDNMHNGSSPNSVLIHQRAIKARRKMEAETAAKAPLLNSEPLPDEVAAVLAAGATAVSNTIAALTGALQSALSVIHADKRIESYAREAAIQVVADARVEDAEAEAQDSFSAVENLEWELHQMTESRDSISAELCRTREDLAAANSRVDQLNNNLVASIDNGKTVAADLSHAREELAAVCSRSAQQEMALETAIERGEGFAAELTKTRESLAAAGVRIDQAAEALKASHDITVDATKRADQAVADLNVSREDLATARAQAVERGDRALQAETRAECERQQAAESAKDAAETRQELALALAHVTQLQHDAAEVPSLRQTIADLEKER